MNVILEFYVSNDPYNMQVTRHPAIFRYDETVCLDLDPTVMKHLSTIQKYFKELGLVVVSGPVSAADKAKKHDFDK